MHDIRLIRENPAAFDAALARRGAEPRSAELIALDERRRAVATEAQTAQARRNEASKAIGAAKASKNEATATALMAEVATLKERLPALEAEERALTEQLDAALAEIPNLPADEVPEGADETGNVEEKRWGTLRDFDFAPKEHADLGPALGMDFEGGAALSGARFTALRGAMARLHRALGQFMLDRQTITGGYTEIAPPLMVRSDAMFGTGQLPKFSDDLFSASSSFGLAAIRDEIVRRIKNTSSNTSLLVEFGELSRITEELYNVEQAGRRWLIPTAEVSLTNLVREQILDASALPIRFTALTPCFRSEAGSAGRDTRGFIRQHQFEKVELVAIVAPEASEAEHIKMLEDAEAILEALDLPYRRMLLCTGDMGFGARKTWDLEVWLPGQNAYREISSISNTGDFQARRMNARYRPEGEKGTRFVHTLNGSGLAVGRTLVAVLENYQQADGSVKVPEVLKPYMAGVERLEVGK